MNNDSSSDLFNKRHDSPQLCMVFDATLIGELPDPSLPAGYEMRGYNPGDESGWADLIILTQRLQRLRFYSIWNQNSDAMALELL